MWYLNIASQCRGCPKMLLRVGTSSYLVGTIFDFFLWLHAWFAVWFDGPHGCEKTGRNESRKKKGNSG